MWENGSETCPDRNTRFETLAAPPSCVTGSWPEAILWPVVGSIASPTIVILLWAVEGEVVV